MRRLPIVISIFLATHALVAQTNYQSWQLHPGRTSYTSRGNIGRGTGEILQGVHASHHRGVLEYLGKCTIVRLRAVSQDQNCATQETFSWVFRSGTDAGGPGTSATAILGEIKNLKTPPSTRTRACAWVHITALDRRAMIDVPCDRHWSFGYRFPVAPSWSMDGQSTHASAGVTGTNPAHNSHPNQQDHAWQIIGFASSATNPSQRRSWRFEAQTYMPVLTLGCGNRYGMGGMFPKSSTSTAPLRWSARLNGGLGYASAQSVVALGASRSSGIPFGPASKLYVNGPYLMFFGPATPRSGIAIVPLVPFVPASARGAGTFHLQGALGLSNGITILANSQSVTF